MIKKTASKRLNTLKQITLSLFFLGTTALYIHNASRDIYGGDVGDLVTAAYTWGIAHPPGYPLFTFLGAIIIHSPLPFPPVFKMGLISIFSSITALYIFYRLCSYLTRSFFVSLLSTSMLAFSYLFWLYALLPEVFALNSLLLLLILFLGVLFYKTGKITYFFLLAFFAGLSLTHHQTILLIFPSIVLLCVKHLRSVILSRKNVFYVLLLFLLGFSVYVYVPLAASRNPVINWDDPKTLDGFLRLILRKDYGTFQAGNFGYSSLLERMVVLKHYITMIISTITFPATLVSLGGMWYMFRKERVIFFAFIIGFLLLGPLFNFYAAFPVQNAFILGASERFYIPSSIILLLFFSYGLYALKTLGDAYFSKKILTYIVLSAFFILPILLFKYNFPKTNLSQLTVGNKLGNDMLLNLPLNAVLLLGGDNYVFNTWYVHYVLGIRPDIQLVQIGEFANNSFLEKEKALYRNKYPNEKDPNKVFVGALFNIKKTRPVYSTASLGYSGDTIMWVPYGLISQMIDESEIPTEEEYIRKNSEIWKKINPKKRIDLTASERNLTLLGIYALYSDSLVKTGNFIFQNYSNIKDSVSFLNKAVDVDPNISRSYSSLAYIQHISLRECAKAQGNIEKALGLDPTEKSYYMQNYILSIDCIPNVKKAKATADTYRSIFKKNIIEDIKKSTNLRSFIK